MSLSKEDVMRAGKLARIKITDLEKTSSQLNGVFNWINQLNTAHSQIENSEIITLTQDLHLERVDENPTHDQRNSVLKNAPHRIHDFFAVPKVKE